MSGLGTMVLPVRIERTTSPFIIGPNGPLDATRLASTPSRDPGLARDCRRPDRTVSPTLGGTLLTVSDQAGKLTKGVLYH